jgi:hypothetical protein
VAALIIAQAPNKPLTVPTHDYDSADDQSLSLQLTPFAQEANGGSEVIGYQMQIDDGQAGPFTTVLGADLDDPAAMTLETQVQVNNLTKGAVYRARYRAINSIGSGEWSNLAYARVAKVPEAPPAPVVSSVDETHIQLALTISSDDGGTGITAYHLYMNEGANGTPMHEIMAYDQSALSYTIAAGNVVDTHTVVSGNIYTIKYLAENAVGKSLDSELLYVALARKPDTPSPPTFDSARSNKTQIVLRWTEGASQDIPVAGYRVYSDGGLPGNSDLVYDGDGVT